MNLAQLDPAQLAAIEKLSARQASRLSPTRSILGRVLLYCGFLVCAAVAWVAHEHFKLHAQSTPALVSLLAAGGFALAPIRLLLGELLAVEGMVMHLVHGVGALAFGGLALGGVISGAPLMRHAALAPFAMMGAAQAIMHQDHPRNPQQAAALQRFASSLPEIAQFTKSGDLTSPANITRAVTVLTDLIGKAQALGETELQSDPGFQSALSRATTHAGLTLSLDAIDHAIQNLAANPAAASAVPGLRRKLAEARKTLADGGSTSSAPR
jgi:hypothetical protein